MSTTTHTATESTTTPTTTTPAADSSTADAAAQFMAERRRAHEEALVELDRNGDVALDFGDALHLVTVLQRAIAAHDICLFGDSSQEQPVDACHGYNLLRNGAEALAHLAKTLYESEWRQIRRMEAGVSIDD